MAKRLLIVHDGTPLTAYVGFTELSDEDIECSPMIALHDAVSLKTTFMPVPKAAVSGLVTTPGAQHEDVLVRTDTIIGIDLCRKPISVKVRPTSYYEPGQDDEGANHLRQLLKEAMNGG